MAGALPWSGTTLHHNSVRCYLPCHKLCSHLEHSQQQLSLKLHTQAGLALLAERLR